MYLRHRQRQSPQRPTDPLANTSPANATIILETLGTQEHTECSVRYHQASSHHTTRVHLIKIGPEAGEQRATGATDTHVIRVTFQAIFRYKVASQPRESLMILQRTVNRSSGMHSCTGHVRRWRSSTQSQGIAGESTRVSNGCGEARQPSHATYDECQEQSLERSKHRPKHNFQLLVSE